MRIFKQLCNDQTLKCRISISECPRDANKETATTDPLPATTDRNRNLATVDPANPFFATGK